MQLFIPGIPRTLCPGKIKDCTQSGRKEAPPIAADSDSSARQQPAVFTSIASWIQCCCCCCCCRRGRHSINFVAHSISCQAQFVYRLLKTKFVYPNIKKKVFSSPFSVSLKPKNEGKPKKSKAARHLKDALKVFNCISHNLIDSMI